MSKYKENKAVALRYNIDEDVSLVVIAPGYGTVAEYIIDIAEKKGIPVFKGNSAAPSLRILDASSDIPVELYEVVTATCCELTEIFTQIRGVEKSRSKSASAGYKEEISRPGRLRRSLVSRHSKDDSQQTV